MAYIIFSEAKLSAKERNQLDDSEFGIPELRKYPLTDKTHVLLAIKFFGKADEKYKPELARRIFAKMKEYNIPESSIGENNELRKYLDKE